MRLRPLVFLVIACLVAGCTPAVRVDPATYAGFEAYCLRNRHVELTVVPAIGRVIHFGRIGGKNVLWDDPAAPGHPLFGWINYGGDKIWLWPQDDWKSRTGRTWPPPDHGLGPHEARVEGDTIMLRSPPIPGYGVRIVREIRLSPSRPEVHFVTRLEAEPGHPVPAAVPWQVTQIPRPDRVIATADTGRLEPHRLEKEATWPGIERQGGSLVLTPTDATQGKLGLDGSTLTAHVGHDRFTVRLMTAGPNPPGERTQVYFDPRHAPGRPAGLTPYAELEFTAPRQAGSPPELQVIWTLHRAP